MKAHILYGPNDIKFEDADMPTLGDGEVLLKVRAAGVCGSDIPRIYKTGAHKSPLIPGHEFAGEVVDAKDASCKTWIGKRVGVFPLIPCKKCGPCREKLYEMCRNYDYLGSRRDGGFAEYVAAPVSNLLVLPENVPFEEAAMLEPMSVAMHAIRRACVKSTDRVVVFGLGTIGLFVTMLLRQMGLEEILVVGNKDFQREQVLRLGVDKDNFCDSRYVDVKDWIMSNTDNNGADVFFECVGKNDCVSLGVSTTAPSKTVCLVGNPYSDMTLDKDTYWKILRNQLTITGTWNSSYTGDEDDDWHKVLRLLADEKIKPAKFISHRFDLEHLQKGFEIMRDKSEDYVKVMAIMN